MSDEAAYTRGGLGQMQKDALKIGARTRQAEVDGVTDFNVTVLGPGGRKIYSFFVANSTQAEAEAIAKKQFTFKLTPAA